MGMAIRFLGTGGSFGAPLVGCRCLGCTSADPRDARLRTSALLELDDRRILLDCGPDLRQQSLREGIAELDQVWLTHAHADHTNGIDDLRPFCFGRGTLPVLGLAETLSETRSRFPYAFRDGEDRSGVSHPRLCARELDGPFEVEGRAVVPVPVEHGPFPCVGYRVGDFAYLTDVSGIPESSWGLLAGVRHLVLSALREEPHPTHLSFEQAIDVARRVGAERTWFTHFAHGTTHSELLARFPAGMGPAWDGLRVELE